MNTRSRVRGGLFGCLAVAALAFGAPLRLGVVLGNSMSPSLRNGSVYLLNRTQEPREIHAGDVVVFRRNGINYIKRVVAIGGDEVYVTTTPSSGRDELVMDWQLKRMLQVFTRPNRYCIKVLARKVPQGTCYVVGDHMSASIDSRELGPIPTESIIGKIVDAPEPVRAMEHLAVISGRDLSNQKS